MSLRVLAKTILFSNKVITISVPSLSRLFLSIFLMVLHVASWVLPYGKPLQKRFMERFLEEAIAHDRRWSVYLLSLDEMWIPNPIMPKRLAIIAHLAQSRQHRA